MKRSLIVATCVFAAVATMGCDKLGLGKKDDGGASSGGGVLGGLSFLGGTFEGEITMLVSGKGTKGGTSQTMIFGIKAPKFRLDLNGAVAADNPLLQGGAGFIIDPPAKRAFMLMPAQKKAIVIDFDKLKAMKGAGLPGRPGAPGAPGAAPEPPPTIQKTGKKEVIAGYECEDWKVISKTSHADMCVAEGIKWIDLSDLGVASPEATLAVAAADLNHFPLRVVAYDDKNVETNRMEATKIEKKKLDEARFVVPPDFQQLDMSAMLGGLQGLGVPGAPGAPGGRPGLPPGFPPGFIPPQPKR